MDAEHEELLDTSNVAGVTGDEHNNASAANGAKPHAVSFEHILDYDALFEKASITKLHDCQLEATSSDVWGAGWQKSAGYR